MNYQIGQLLSKETWNKCLRKQIASLRGFLVTAATAWLNIASRVSLHRNWRCRNLAVYRILSRLLRSVRLALYLARRLILRFPKLLFFGLLFLSFNSHAAMSDITQIYQQVPSMDGFSICIGGGCAEVRHVSLTEQEWLAISSIFTQMAVTPDARQERDMISRAIGAFEKIVGDKTGTATDLAGTFGNSDHPGQLDCNDEAINSTTYMRLMRQKGLIKLHEVEDMRTRNFFFTGWPHSAAVIHDIATKERFAVDSWFYDNGHPATIVPFLQWKSGYTPADSPVLKK